MRVGALLLLVMFVGLLLRLHCLTTVHSWFDESLGWRMAQFPPAEIVERSQRNVHPPMHFLLLSGWSRVFGGSLASLRFYSLFWGMGTILGGFFLAAAAMNRSCMQFASPSPHREPPPATTGWGIALIDGQQALAGLLAALLIALSSLHVDWSQQVKMYTLGTCLTIWSTWLLLRWFQCGGAWRLIGYVPLAAALSLQHHYGTFTVFAQLTFALLWSARRSGQGIRKGDFTSILVTTWATSALWSLWLPSFLVQRSLVKNSYWIGAFDWHRVVDVWSGLFLAKTSVHVSSVGSAAIAQLVLMSVLLLLVHRQAGARLMGWLVLVPYAIAVGWSIWDQNVMASRFLINAHACLLTGLAILVASIPVTSLRYGTAIVLAIGVGITGCQQRVQRTKDAEMPGMPLVISTLREAKSAEERVLVCNPMLYLNACVYGEGLEDIYAFDPGQSFPHFQGTPVMKAEEYCSLTDLDAATGDWVWTLDAEQWLGGTWKVQLPREWRLQEERRIREWYATLVIRAYRRESAIVRVNSQATGKGREE